MAEEDRFVDLEHDLDGTEVFSLQEKDGGNENQRESDESKPKETVTTTETPKK